MRTQRSSSTCRFTNLAMRSASIKASDIWVCCITRRYAWGLRVWGPHSISVQKDMNFRLYQQPRGEKYVAIPLHICISTCIPTTFNSDLRTGSHGGKALPRLWDHLKRLIKLLSVSVRSTAMALTTAGTASQAYPVVSVCGTVLGHLLVPVT